MQARTKRESKSLEDLGHYSPISKKLVVNKERIEYWLGVGAQPTETVNALLVKQGVLKPAKHKKTYSSAPKRKSQERAAAKTEKAEAAKAAKEEAKKQAEEAKEAAKAEEAPVVDEVVEAPATEPTENEAEKPAEETPAE